MNANLLRRIVRAIAEDATEDLAPLAKKLVEAERTSGHTRLADELAAILERPRGSIGRSPGRTDTERGLRELPLSRRDRAALATLVPHDALEHHMVLAEEVEARFVRIEKEFAARERLGAYGLRARKTVLLYGPPGCGKSLGAKRLAWNVGLPLMKIRFDALISSYFGESAANLRAVFDAAKENACVLLFDECDFIARSRVGSRDVGEASRIANTLLQLMEEYDAPGLLVATTNIEDSLDAALFRRFDDVFLIPPPGPEEVLRLLRLTLSSTRQAEGIDWTSIVHLLEGASAAHVVKCAMDAAKTAVLSGRAVVDEALLRESVRDSSAGQVRGSRG